MYTWEGHTQVPSDPQDRPDQLGGLWDGRRTSCFSQQQVDLLLRLEILIEEEKGDRGEEEDGDEEDADKRTRKKKKRLRESSSH